jgi:hypothetical protein
MPTGVVEVDPDTAGYSVSVCVGSPNTLWPTTAVVEMR